MIAPWMHGPLRHVNIADIVCACLCAFLSQAIVIATPFQLSFDYDAMAEAAAAKFDQTVRHHFNAFTGVAAAVVPC